MAKWAIVRVGIVVFGLCALWAGRAADAGVAVSPLKQEISLRPGEAGKVTLTITNNRRNEFDPAQAMHVKVMDVQVSEGGALNFMEAGTAKDSAGKWVSVSQDDVALEPGKSLTLECDVTPPVSAAPGEYYAAVMVTLANPGKNEKGLAVEYRIASGIFVTVQGQTFPRQARVSRCELIWPEATSEPAASQPAEGEEPATRPAMVYPKISVLLENTGKARFDGSGRITVVDEKARTIYAAVLTSQRPCVFAGDSRVFETPIVRALPAGKYRVKVEMDYQSMWGKARYEMPLEILPASAELMARLQGGGVGGGVAVEVGPERLTGTIPAGAMRSMALAVVNKGEGSVRCGARLGGGSASDAWIALSAQEFVLTKGARKSMGVVISVPKGTPAGKYVSTIAVGAGIEGSGGGKDVTIPVELEVPAEK